MKLRQYNNIKKRVVICEKYVDKKKLRDNWTTTEKSLFKKTYFQLKLLYFT